MPYQIFRFLRSRASAHEKSPPAPQDIGHITPGIAGVRRTDYPAAPFSRFAIGRRTSYAHPCSVASTFLWQTATNACLNTPTKDLPSIWVGFGLFTKRGTCTPFA